MFKAISDLFVRPERSLSDAMTTLNESGIGIALIVDGDCRLVGTLTDGDIRRALLQGGNLEAPISVVMNRRPITAPERTAQPLLLELMRRERILQVPLVNERGQVVDITWQARLLEMAAPRAATTPVVIMCGGEGKRLRPLTEDRPKPLLPVGGKPVLEHELQALADGGFVTVHLAVNYRWRQIEEHFGDGSAWGLDIHYHAEETPMGTAGALARLRDRLQEPTLVMMGDLMTRVDFRKLLEFHEASGDELTMGVTPYQVRIPYGVVDLEGDQVRGMQEKPVYSYFTNGGIYVVEPSALALIPSDTFYDMTDLVDRLVRQRSRVGAFPMHEYWLDIGRHDQFVRAQMDFGSVKVARLGGGDAVEPECPMAATPS